MARRECRPFMMTFCCVVGLLASCPNSWRYAAKAEPFHHPDRASLVLVRPVAYVEAESISDAGVPDSHFIDSKISPIASSVAVNASGVAGISDSSDSETLSFFLPLRTQLEEVSRLGNSQVQSWATEAIACVHNLADVAAGNPSEVRVACDRLDRAVREAYLLASMGMSDEEADRLRRGGYAIQRRVAICRILLPLETAEEAEMIAKQDSLAQVDPKRLDNAVRKVDALLKTDPAGKTWREFLLLDELANLPKISDQPVLESVSKDPGGVTQRRAVVRKALANASDVWLNEQQQAFLQSPEFLELGAALRAEAAGPISRRKILMLIQQYEAFGLPSVAKQLADETMWLSLLSSLERLALRQELTNHYRNANFRIEVAEVLMDRLIPPRTAELAPVRDTVLGRPVRGESLTETQIGVRFLPSEERLMVAIDVTGEVDASTLSTSGPATFRNRSFSWYHAQKPIEITTSGLKIMPTEVLEVRNSTRLRSLRTSLDGVPLLGSLVNDVARSQHDSKQPEMQDEIRRKVATRARDKIEMEANERLSQMAKRFEEQILQPLDRLSLGPTLVQAKTTDDRLVMRARLASVRQLGAHTARPKAPSDSLLSFQIHESAMNNAIERLKLNGRTFKVSEIREKLAEILKRPDLAEDSSKHDDATITFATEDAIRVKLDDGRLRINLAVAELREGAKAWHDFEVIVFYIPVSDGLATHLARDGVVQLDAGQVSFRSQVTLRGVFCTVFTKNRTIPLLPPKVAEHPKMADLYLSQLELDSGWLAVALSSHEQTIAKQPEPDDFR